MRWDLEDLISPADIAEEFGASRPTVSNWMVRYPDFPQPLTTVAQGHTPIYSRKSVLDWYDRKEWQHDGPRSRKQKHRPGGNGRAVDIPPDLGPFEWIRNNQT